MLNNYFDEEVISRIAKMTKNMKEETAKKLGKKVIESKKVFIDGKQYTEKTFRDNWDTYTRYYAEPRMVLTRKIARNMAKKSQGNNRIRRKWRRFQIERYGVSNWCRMYNCNNCNSKEHYITPETAMSI